MRIDITYPDGEINTIEATEEFAEEHYPGAWAICAEQAEPAQPPAAPQHISVGAFYDRFGSAKWAILSDESPQVRAVVQDASVRKYIDLDNAELPAGLAILQAAGHDIDPAAIIDAPIRSHEMP